MDSSIRRLGKKSTAAEIRAGLPRLYPRLWRYCLVRTGHRADADDLAQATCLRAIENAQQFTPGTHLDRWIFRIAQRLWYNQLRAQKVRRGGGLISVENIDLPAEGMSAETNILAREVLAKLQVLPEAQRMAVLFVYVEGFSYKEAAELMDVPVGTIMSRLSAARKRLAPLADTQEQVQAQR